MDRRKRQEGAREFVSKDGEFPWSVVWSDEGKFCRYSDSGKGYAWTEKTEIWKAECLQATVRYGGGRVNVVSDATSRHINVAKYAT